MHQHADIVKAYRPLAALVPSHWQSGAISAADGTAIHYTRTGIGSGKPALLLLHGSQVNGLTWLRTAQSLETAYDIVMPDFRGHGKTGGLGHNLSADLLVSDVITVIRALNLEDPYVIGHSMGAEIAGRLASVYPARGMVMVDPALQNIAAMLHIDWDNLPDWYKPFLEAMRALKTMSHAERMQAGLSMMPPGSSIYAEADYVSFIEGQAEFEPSFFRYARNLGCLFESPDVLNRIACPALLLTAGIRMPGANVGPGLSAYKDNVRTLEHIEIQNSGHFIMADQFDQFIAVLRTFLKAH